MTSFKMKTIFSKVDGAMDAVSKAMDGIGEGLEEFASGGTGETNKLQTDDMTVKVESRAVTINGDVASVKLNGKVIWKAVQDGESNG